MSAYKVVSLSGHDPALASYRNMIYSDFLKSLRFGNEWYRLIDSDRYYRVYHKIIDQLLERTDSQVHLALLADEPDVCLGWSLFENQKLHYVFVKGPYRKQGIGSSLIPKLFNEVTHLTKIGQAIRLSKFNDVIFDPFT